MCLYSSLTKPGLFDHDQEIVIRSIFEAHTKMALYSLSPGTKLLVYINRVEGVVMGQV